MQQLILMLGSTATAFTVPLAVAVVIVVLAMLAVGYVKSYLHICRPDEVLIFSGRKSRHDDGSERGFRVVFGGRGWRYPMLEKVDRMSLACIEVPISVRNAYSKGGIPLGVDAVANIKISSDTGRIGNAIERFLGRDSKEIQRVAKETLEGHLRGVLASLTPEEVNEDRLKFANKLSDDSDEDLNKLGIQLDTLKIQHVSDEMKYLDSIGRQAIALVVKDAEMAESDAYRDAEQREAAAAARANVTNSNVDAKIAQMKNELRRIQADLEAKVKSEEERTLAAARQARALAEQELQGIRAQLEAIRLQTDRVLPAEARKVFEQYKARGEAALIREQGRAVGEAVDLMNQAWLEAGDDALTIYLIEELEKILQKVAGSVKRVKIEHVTLIDGGQGNTLAAYAGVYPAMMTEVFDAVARTTGIDIPAIVGGRNNGGGDAAGTNRSRRPSTTPSGFSAPQSRRGE